jgi:putative transposase
VVPGLCPVLAGQSPASTRTIAKNILQKSTGNVVSAITALCLRFNYLLLVYLDRKYSYRRTLPHILKNNRPVFVTFGTFKRWVLPVEARQIVFDHCLREHEATINLQALVIMPAHAHLLFTPLRNEEGWPVSLPHVMRLIKGRSAHSITRLLRRSGRVWQEESFDHVLRSNESLHETANYICQNPVRARLVGSKSDYRWLWRGEIPVL